MKVTTKFARRGMVASAIVASIVLIAGCAQEAPPEGDTDGMSLEESAIKEGSLLIYGGSADNQMKALVDGFNEKYPSIQVDYFRAPGASLLNRFATEAESGSVIADVFMPTVQPEFITDTHSEWFVEITDDEFPAAENWPADFREDRVLTAWVQNVVLGYNVDQVESAPTSWEDALDARFKGKIMLLDPRASAATMAWYEIIRDAYGDDFLTQLVGQNGQWVDSAAVGAQQVAAGAFAMSFPTYASQLIGLEQSGAPVGIAKDLDPNMALFTYFAVPEDAPHPNAARLFASWLLGPDGREVICADHVYAAIGGGDSACEAVLPGSIPPNFSLSDEEKAHVLELLNLE